VPATGENALNTLMDDNNGSTLFGVITSPRIFRGKVPSTSRRVFAPGTLSQFSFLNGRRGYRQLQHRRR
jgi:hypothetical protein